MKTTTNKAVQKKFRYHLQQFFLVCIFLCLLAGMLYVLINSAA